MTKKFDVIVIGAGPAGSASSFFLASQGLKVLLLDKASFPRDKTCGDALSSRSLNVIQKMGGLEKVLSVGKKVSSIKIVPPNGNSLTLPIPIDNNLAVVICQRFTLDTILKDLAIDKGVKLVEDFWVRDIHTTDSYVEVSGNKQTYQAEMIVLATGANTSLLKKIGAIQKQPKIMHASRVYYENVGDLDKIIFNYDFSVLPSYGWVFPLPNGGANIGAGFFRTKLNSRKLPKTSQETLQNYLAFPQIKNILRNASPVGKIKSYPLRVDFMTAPKFIQRGVVVGEAAGLVSPISGEGIDYALESGELAANHIVSMFEENDFSLKQGKKYQILLDKEYKNSFMQYEWIRDSIFSSSFLINRLINKARKNPLYGQKFLNVSLRNISPINILS